MPSLKRLILSLAICTSVLFIASCKNSDDSGSGDQLRMEVDFLRSRMSMAKVHGKIHVGDELACEADLMFAYVE